MLGEDRLVIRRILAALLVLGVLISCSGGSDSDSDITADPMPTVAGQPRPAKAAPAPEPRRCYRMSYTAALAPTTRHRPVSCRKPHTARTFFVGRLDTVVDGHLLAVDARRVRAQVADTCPRRFAAYVGGSAEARRLSMLATVWFSPTVEQSEGGQSWFRCDVVAVESPRRLASLTGVLKAVLDTAAGRARWGRCATAKPGTESSEHVICARDDAWRAVATVDVAPGSDGRWPGLKAARDAGDRCEDKVRALASSPLNFSWGYEWPTAAQWNAGQHHGYCWAPRGN